MNRENIGWIVSLWIDAFQTQINDREDLPYLSWSPYDRVTIDEVTNFSDFFNETKSLNWSGTVQRLHLIPMGVCNWKLNEGCLIATPDSKNRKYGIYCIVTARFKQHFQNLNEIDTRIQNKLSDCLQGEDIQWQGFHSLGAEDYVGIFLANDIVTLSNAVDIIKQFTYTENGSRQNKILFDSVYSLLGFNDSDFEQEPKADLLVRLYPKSGYTRQEINLQLKTEFNKVFGDSAEKIRIREIVSGKSCLEIEIPSHVKSLVCFHNNENAIFNGQSKFYKDYIESSRTYWCISQGHILNADDANIGTLISYSDKVSVYTMFEVNYIHPISKFILKEYERMIGSTRCLWWKSILQHQYETYVGFVKEYTDEGNENALCMLNNEVQTVLLHINQAIAPIYEVPYHNYYYAGSYNDILKMYYGVIADIFNIAYKLPHDKDTYQYEIAYSVNFEAATKVHSSIYTMKNDTRRFVVFHLPYDAFMKFDRTIQLLLHEVFHYIAPFSRHNRNFIFLKIIINYIWEQYIAYLTEKGLTENNSKVIMGYFFKHFGALCQTIEKVINNDFFELVLNEFTMLNPKIDLAKFSEEIFVILYSKANQDLEVWFEEVKCDNTFNKVHEALFGNRTDRRYSFIENIRRTALAEKEAFCDLNMIYILGLSLNDYLLLLYDSLFGDYNKEKVNEDLDVLIDTKKIKIGSFELRIGMVLNYYLDLPSDADVEAYRDSFDEELKKISDENPNTPKKFYAYLSNAYERYLTNYRTEIMLHKEFFSGEKKWFDFFKNNDSNKKLKDAASGQTQIKDYISVIRNFKSTELENHDLTLCKTQTLTAKYANIDVKEFVSSPIEVCDLGDYVTRCCRMINDWKDKVVWFRGICNKSYKLTPSLFRNIDEKLSLYSRQAGFLKGAYYATLSEPTLWTEQLKNVLEHMSFLQHYGIPTSLLDFTDDMLMALHFALNPDDKGDLEAVDKHILQPKVVLFNPFIYNDAVASLKKGEPVSQPRNESPICVDIRDEQLLEYYVHNTSKTFLTEHSENHTKPYIPNPRTNLYPLPIAVRRANARITAQNGTFLAYNLNADPDKRIQDKDQYYSYLALENIQNEYWKLLELEGKPKEDGTFIKEIYINKIAISTIKKQLKTMHITTARAYPEIFRIFDEYMDEQKS